MSRGDQLDQVRARHDAERAAARALHDAEHATAVGTSEAERSAAETAAAGETARQRSASDAEEARARAADAYVGEEGAAVVQPAVKRVTSFPQRMVGGTAAAAAGGAGLFGLAAKKVLDFTGLSKLGRGAWNAFAEATDVLPGWAKIEKLPDPHKKGK